MCSADKRSLLNTFLFVNTSYGLIRYRYGMQQEKNLSISGSGVQTGKTGQTVHVMEIHQLP